MVATSVFIPYEVLELTAKVTVLRAVAFAINVALVIYLVLTKRLFGARGGKKAYEARLRSASILQAEIDALAAAQIAPAAAAAQSASGPRPGDAGQPGEADQPRDAGQPRNADQPGDADQPGEAGTDTRADPDPRGGAQAADGTDQPTDAAATSSSAAE
jgi:hypothetical protein